MFPILNILKNSGRILIPGMLPSYRQIELCNYLLTMSKETKVLYNAECPVCNFEIKHYERYSEKRDLPIRFDDLNTDVRESWGIDEDTAARRLYVEKDGQLYSGIPAFIELWKEMPHYKWAAWLAALPLVKQVTIFGYNWVLAPAIYRWHVIRRKRQGRPVKRTTA